ncbi:metallophosphoesterase [Zavarzinia compransoris]|nr:metallophosphoesterase [Zavarzinia compransoris]
MRITATIPTSGWSDFLVETRFKGHVIGDMHGVSSILEVALNIVDERGGTLVTLGDYIDRGPDSLGVIDMRIEAGKRLDPIGFAGKHDRFLWRSIQDRRPAKYWLENGDWMLMRELGGSLSVETLGAERAAFLYGLIDDHRAGDLVFSPRRDSDLDRQFRRCPSSRRRDGRGHGCAR